MELTPLSAVSPVDGRYRKQTSDLGSYFSEGALIRYRVFVEVEYFIALCNIPLPNLKDIKEDKIEAIRNIYLDFSIEDAQKVKDIEKITNHDIKAVEYYVKEQFGLLDLGDYKEFIHFGLTSQDINNTAIPYSTMLGFEEVMAPVFDSLIDLLENKASEWKEIPMLAHTHGQPASPTRLGKEILVFIERLNNQFKLLIDIPFSGKFGGATGNFNAHVVAFPEINWVEFANKFLKEALGLERLQTTTQIEHYDNLGAFFDAMKRINTILIDFCRDMWTYISMEYFKQKIIKGEVGSSAMPHKVNPIDFENAEGNLGVANAMFAHLTEKLPISRLQRDLTDSTVTRNIGVPFAHTLIALKAIMKGVNKLLLNEEKIMADLEDNWAVVAEAIQTILRRENYPDPYEALLELTRTNKKMDRETISAFIDSLNVSDSVKMELKKISPANYTGIKIIS